MELVKKYLCLLRVIIV